MHWTGWDWHAQNCDLMWFPFQGGNLVGLDYFLSHPALPDGWRCQHIVAVRLCRLMGVFTASFLRGTPCASLWFADVYADRAVLCPKAMPFAALQTVEIQNAERVRKRRLLSVLLPTVHVTYCLSHFFAMSELSLLLFAFHFSSFPCLATVFRYSKALL